jgi:hypothetical protein
MPGQCGFCLAAKRTGCFFFSFSDQAIPARQATGIVRADLLLFSGAFLPFFRWAPDQRSGLAAQKLEGQMLGPDQLGRSEGSRFAASILEPLLQALHCLLHGLVQRSACLASMAKAMMGHGH